MIRTSVHLDEEFQIESIYGLQVFRWHGNSCLKIQKNIMRLVLLEMTIQKMNTVSAS